VIIDTQEPDTLTLDTVKKFLLIEHTLDDELLNIYIKTSLAVAGRYLHQNVLTTTYAAEPKELIDIEYGIFLTLPDRPYEVEVEYSVGGSTYTQTMRYFEGKYVYAKGQGLLFIDVEALDYAPDTITGIKALAGFENADDADVITQGRLFLIGDWYKFRENNVTFENVLPNGTKLLFDLVQESQL